MSKRSTDQTMSRSSTASINEAILVSYSNIRQSGYVQGSTGDHHCFTSADASSMEIRDDYPYPPLPAIADVSCSTQSKISNESTVTGVYLYQATETSDRARFRARCVLRTTRHGTYRVDSDHVKPDKTSKGPAKRKAPTLEAERPTKIQRSDSAMSNQRKTLKNRISPRVTSSPDDVKPSTEAVAQPQDELKPATRQNSRSTRRSRLSVSTLSESEPVTTTAKGRGPTKPGAKKAKASPFGPVSPPPTPDETPGSIKASSEDVDAASGGSRAASVPVKRKGSQSVAPGNARPPPKSSMPPPSRPSVTRRRSTMNSASIDNTMEVPKELKVTATGSLYPMGEAASRKLWCRAGKKWYEVEGDESPEWAKEMKWRYPDGREEPY